MSHPPEPDVVQTEKEAELLTRPPLLILERVAAFLDDHALGSGPVTASRIGDGGGSNFSFLLERDGERYVLRRPPRPPLPPSAHDVVREARLQLALAPMGIRVPHIRAVCEDGGLLGVPFYVADYIEGFVVTDELPPGLVGDAEARRRLAEDLVDTLVEIHGADIDEPALAPFVRPGSYLERQVRRFSQLWEVNATRPLPLVGDVGARLAKTMPGPIGPGPIVGPKPAGPKPAGPKPAGPKPAGPKPAGPKPAGPKPAGPKPAGLVVVHGDYRLGNMIVAPGRPHPIVAALDWEMGAIGDPRADVGYLIATYSSPGGEPSALGTSPVTATPGFLTGEEMAARYVQRSGRDVEPLAWFEALALWKAAVFCEAIYGRFIRGELTADDERAAAFETIVPALAETASEKLAQMKPPG